MPKKSRTISSTRRQVVMERFLMTVLYVKIVVSVIYAVTRGATVSAPSVIPIVARPCALTIAKKYARGCQNLPMFAMVVNYRGLADWRKGSTLQA
ncbi:MAG: hypothetical protein PHI65_10000 [Firmicutes bacterium]|nr:hypothetical protein [Bacillota bacterium]